MRVHHADPLPSDWSCLKGVVAETDLKMSRGSKLALKLLIFDKPANMRRFWKGVGTGDLGKDCLGFVNALGYHATNFADEKPTERYMADPKYFAIMGLCVGHLGMEIISHESVHAGFCYAKRVGMRSLFAKFGDFDEELVAYPSGKIASLVNSFLHDNNLYAQVSV